MGIFEQHPILFVVAVIAIGEFWNLAKQLLSTAAHRAGADRK